MIRTIRFLSVQEDGGISFELASPFWYYKDYIRGSKQRHHWMDMSHILVLAVIQKAGLYCITPFRGK